MVPRTEGEPVGRGQHSAQHGRVLRKGWPGRTSGGGQESLTLGLHLELGLLAVNRSVSGWPMALAVCGPLACKIGTASLTKKKGDGAAQTVPSDGELMPSVLAGDHA